MIFKVQFLANIYISIDSDVATSTTSRLLGCGCCDNRCWYCLPVEFLLPERFRKGEKLHTVLMVGSKECENIIPVPLMQFKEGFLF